MATESSKVVTLHTEKTKPRKRQSHPSDPERLQLAHDMPELPLSAREVCAELGISRRTLNRWCKLPGFPQPFQYHPPRGKNYWVAGEVHQWKRQHPMPR
jgi:predicted DNA-binding transcriptional regulator AlpA